MSSSEFETEAVRPVSERCDDTRLFVTLADGRQISALRLWPALDDGVSVKALLLGWKAPGAKLPNKAA